MNRLRKLAQHLNNPNSLTMVRAFFPFPHFALPVCHIEPLIGKRHANRCALWLLQSDTAGSIAAEAVIEETNGSGFVRFFHHPQSRLGEILLNRPQKMNAVTKGASFLSVTYFSHASSQALKVRFTEISNDRPFSDVFWHPMQSCSQN